MFTHKDFSQHLGKATKVYSSDLEHHREKPPEERYYFGELLLHEVIDDSNLFGESLIDIFGRAPFRLYLKGQANFSLPQAVYRFEAPWHEAFEQLLVPVIEPGCSEGMYQLVFN